MLAHNTSSTDESLAQYIDKRGAAAKMGLNWLIAAISSMFFLFFVSYIIRSQVSDWEALSMPWQPLAETNQLWINSLLLILASAAFEGARREFGKPELGMSRELLWLAGAASLAFLLGQSVAWNFLVVRGFYIESNPANSFFFLLTGLHALHLAGGLVAWIVANFRLTQAIRAGDDKSQGLARISMDLCAIYWHFLMALWLVVFALISSSPSTYAAIAEFCGLTL